MSSLVRLWVILVAATVIPNLANGLTETVEIFPLKPTNIVLNREESYVYTYGLRKDDGMDTKIFQSVGHFKWQEKRTEYLSMLYPENWPVDKFFEVTYVEVLLKPLTTTYEVSITGPIDSALVAVNILAQNTQTLEYEVNIYGYAPN